MSTGSGTRKRSPASPSQGSPGGSGRTLLALLAVVAAILLIGYFAFVNTGGAGHAPRKGVAPASGAAP